MAEPLLILRKSAEKTTNKIIIPKQVIERMGRNFEMKIFKDKIVLKPFEEGE